MRELACLFDFGTSRLEGRGLCYVQHRCTKYAMPEGQSGNGVDETNTLLVPLGGSKEAITESSWSVGVCAVTYILDSLLGLRPPAKHYEAS